MTGEPAEGVALRSPGGVVRLKWHCLRRKRADPAFTPKRLAEGLALGASMEVDLQLHAAGGFAVLHEAMLEGETTGKGPVAAASPEYLRTLRILGEDGKPTDAPVLLLEDLVDLMQADAAPGALVQLDLKATHDQLSPNVTSGFGEIVGPCIARMILSGEDWTAVNRLAGGAPGLVKGFDPCRLPEAQRLARASDVADFVALTLRIAPDAAMIYLAWPLVLHALDLGHDIVGAFHREGRMVDAWTLNTDASDCPNVLRRLVACRVDQITTDEPVRMQALWREIGGA